VGDIMTDSLKLGLELAKDNSDILNELTLNPGTFLLLTLHRPYNVDDPKLLSLILSGLNSLNKLIVFPVHPRTRNILCQIEPEKFNNIRFIEPLSYLDFLTLMQASEMILTDSGGIQKEAYIIGKLCITLRPETEWIETVKTGWNILLPPQSKEFPEKILSVSKPSIHPPLFGSDVSQKILSVLEQA